MLRRRRAALAAGAAIGASAFFAPSAGATNYPVTNTSDHAANACDAECTLRDAVTAANANAGDDTISFQSGVTGTIRLAVGVGEIPVDPVTAGNKLTITGPGRSVLTVSGDANNDNIGNVGDSRIFNVGATNGAPLTVSGLTLTRGFNPDNGGAGGGGGAVLAGNNSPVTFIDSAITNSKSEDVAGGGGVLEDAGLTLIRTTMSGNTATGGGASGGAVGTGSFVPLTLSGSTISGNSAVFGGGLAAYGVTSIDSSRITGNHATGRGGGIFSVARLTITRSTLSGNTAVGDSGGLESATKYATSVSDSVISGNTAVRGGGVTVSAKYPSGTGGGPTDIERTTISGNRAGKGAGLFVKSLGSSDQLTLFRSTISGNRGNTGSFGGGIYFGNTSGAPIDGDFRLSDSTVSGNLATVGGGVSVGDSTQQPVIGSKGSISFDNSTIASNSASTKGGGVYLNRYSSGSPAVSKSATIAVTSTVAANNAIATGAQDLDRADGSTGGGFSLAFSLVEKPGDAPVPQSPAGSSIIGVDPQLGPLANNGGTTLTHLPAVTSPLIDKGVAPARLLGDQRGHARTVNGAGVANPPRGDGTDIGAVEIDNPPGKKVDHKPSATIKRNRLASKKRKKRVASGTARDDHKVASVEVAIVRRVRGKCRELLEQGVFGKRRKCRVPHSFLHASGKRKWKFRLERKLHRGRYTVYARAVDSKGHRQTKFSKKSRRKFRVK
jgi:hypothetical protein